MRTTLAVSAGFNVAPGPLPRDSLDNTSTPWEAIPVYFWAEAEPFFKHWHTAATRPMAWPTGPPDGTVKVTTTLTSSLEGLKVS